MKPHREHRAATMGVGIRFTHMIRKSEAPSPERYSPDTSYEKERSHKGVIFGTSREKFAKVYIKEHPAPDLKIPGPASYNPSYAQAEKNTGQFSLRPRTTFRSSKFINAVKKSIVFFDPCKNNPGPGAYESLKAIENRNGYTTHSRFKSPGATIFSKPGPRFDDSDMRRAKAVPGPGQYSMSFRSGKDVESKFKNPGAPLIGKTKRKIELETSETRKCKSRMLNLWQPPPVPVPTKFPVTLAFPEPPSSTSALGTHNARASEETAREMIA